MKIILRVIYEDHRAEITGIYLKYSDLYYKRINLISI